MPSPSHISPLFVLSGLVGGNACVAPAPTLELSELQLRAINHRFISPAVDRDGSLMDALTGDDFLLTDADGTWHGRSAFLARMGNRPSQAELSTHDVRIRRFGPVALVHAVFSIATMDGQMTRLRYTDVHVWSGTCWRLVSVHNTPITKAGSVALQSGTAPARTASREVDPPGEDLAVLKALNQQYVKAFRETDVAWYDRHLAPDYVVTAGDGSFHDRAAALTRFAKPTYAQEMRSFPVRRVTVRRFDETALIHAENAYVLKDNRRGVSRYTDIWHKNHQDGRSRWLCIAAHITEYKTPD